MQNEIQIHDIKPIVDIEEYSFYYFLGAVGIGILLLIGISYLLYLWYKRRHAFNLRVEHAKLLNSLNLSDTKNTAYAISVYGNTFKDDSPRHAQMYKNISDRLENYKYRKNVEKFDSDTLGYIELYKGMIDV
jgi:hypothetical protein